MSPQHPRFDREADLPFGESANIKRCEPISASSKARRGKEINDDREANRADARGSAEKEPGNYFWGGPSAHASANCWVCSVLWSHNSSYDSAHIADLIRAR